MSKLAHNERIKYMATYFNNAGVAAFVAGAILPSMNGTDKVWLYWVGGVVLGAALAVTAQVVLGSLKD